MSAFDPSILDNKDRDELSQIAEQLGKKPPARAKKADIVALILQLAGVDADGSTETASGADAEAHAAVTPADETPADETPAVALSQAGAEPASGSGEQPTPAAPVGADARGDDSGHDVPDRGNQRSAAAQQAGQQRADHPNSSAPGSGGTPGNGNGGGNRPGEQAGAQSQTYNSGQNGGASNGGGQNGGGQNGNQRQPGAPEDAESGNRRRRRRGRGGAQEAAGDEAFQGEPVDVTGLLDLREEGYGFLRLRGYLPSADDVYVSVKQVRQFALRKGDHIAGKSRPAGRNEKNPALLQIDAVNGGDPEEMKQRPRFDDLTPLFPDERMVLERKSDALNMTARIIDLVAPIGKGQRGLIVSPPKAGKTAIMKEIARSIETNHPEVQLIVLLVDERPEEVTDMKRWLHHGEVAASTFDRPSEEHTHVAELVIERAKRLVEERKDVVIILDGITRLARAYNLAAPGTGRIMSGGIDTGALYPPKKFFGAARNVEEGGSLTILATALVETGSRMDEVIFEEFKGTGNMELRLDRRLAERRIFPAVDIEASSTRREDLLITPKQVEQVWKVRRMLAGLKAEDGMSPGLAVEKLLENMRSFKTNEAFLAEIAKA